MTKVEIAMLIGLALIPIIALVIILPKNFKKSANKKVIKETKPVEIKAEKPIEEKPIEKSAEASVQTGLYHRDNADDMDSFRKYLSERKKTTAPTRKPYNPELERMTTRYMPQHSISTPTQPAQKTISEQIDALSPELKAIILSGVFDKKDF